MNRFLKLLIVLVTAGIYLAALRYFAPPDQPNYVLGIGIVALASWLLGTIPGIIIMVVLIPLTNLIYHQFPISTNYSTFAGSPAYLTIQLLIAFSLGHLRRKTRALRAKDAELQEANTRLQSILSEVQELGGLHNMCGECKNIQNDDGVWQPVDVYLKEQTKMEFSHCICPKCAESFNDSYSSGLNV